VIATISERRNAPANPSSSRALSRTPDRSVGSDIERGLIDADLGGGVIKQRTARKGGGKSGGFRALILLRMGERAFFVHGFAKSDRDNIRADELVALRKLAGELLNYDDAALAKAIAAGVLTEVER
jgi:hypothetical protein